MKKSSLLILSLIITALCAAQDKFWKFETSQSFVRRNTPQLIIPRVYRTLSLSFEQYKSHLNTAPAESLSNYKSGLEISLPYPDNTFKKFRIVETKMMEEALAAQFPQIKTYVGQGLDDPGAIVRIDYTTQGFHAFVISAEGFMFIDPYQKENNNLYITYLSKDYEDANKAKFKCLSHDLYNRPGDVSAPNAPLAGTCIGPQLKTYRAAISCTGEYAVAVCPAGNVTVANTLSAIVTTMNRVNGVYQTELGVKMQLISAEASVIYTDPNTDPYTGNNDANVLIDESQSNITSVIGSSNFDIGHTFSTGAGGLASLGVVCSSGSKAQGVTGLSNPVGDEYDIDYVSHEIGHQFGATHTFESELNDCGGGNRSKSSAYEPGSGTTIMSYASPNPGLCGSDNIQPHSDPYFHTKSFDQIVAYTTTGNGNACPVVSLTGNNSPVVFMPASGIKIPKQTPFTLLGTATDADGDSLSYSWEQWDFTNLNAGSKWNSGDTSTTAPLFKTRVPNRTGSRTFPDMAIILANYPSSPSATMDGLKGEILPGVARDIKFRLVVRDNNPNCGGVATGGSGCSSTAAFKVVVTNDGPFRVTSPNTAVNWLGGSTHNITWQVANTNNASGINTQNVDILMSTDGGQTYPTVLKLSTPNDGATSVTIPNVPANNSARIMVRAVGNIFFDISNVNFTITYNSTLPVSLLQLSAAPNDNSILLTWLTTMEHNNKGFEIFRSEESDNNFVSIGFVEGGGTSSLPRQYTFADNNVRNGVNYYYRLKQSDVDNNINFSSIVKAILNKDNKFNVILRPQPFYDDVTLLVSGLVKVNFSVTVSDMMGRIVQRQNINNDKENRELNINLSNEASGLYIITILQGTLRKNIQAMKR